MRYSQLRAFHNVALHGGFSRAAAALFLSQPAVSEQVRKLEQDYDVLLFHRERKRVQLTEQGERLFILTNQLFETEERIEEYLSESRTAITGRLRIVADSAHHVTEVLSSFRADYPEVFVTLQTGNTAEVLAKLRAYNAEIGVVGSLDPGKDFDRLDLGTSPIVAFAARGFLAPREQPYALSELAKMPLVFREKGSKTRQKLEEFAARLGIDLTPTIEAEGREAVREIVASGAGVGFVSEAEFGNDARLVRLPLKRVRMSMTETLVCLSQRRDVRVIRAFMRKATAHIQKAA